jgi:hypothetical protein
MGSGRRAEVEMRDLHTSVERSVVQCPIFGMAGRTETLLVQKRRQSHAISGSMQIKPHYDR